MTEKVTVPSLLIHTNGFKVNKRYGLGYL